MKKLLTIVGVLLVATAQAQFTGHFNALNITGTQYVLKTEIPMAEPSVVGSTYLSEEWQTAVIVTKSGYAAGLPLRIELEQLNMEVKIDNEVKYLNQKKIDSVYLINDLLKTRKLLVDARKFSFEGEPLKGIVLVQYVNQYAIVENHYIETLAANYNVAMDVGSKNHRKVKKAKTFILFNGELISTKGSYKKIASQLGSDKDKALSVLKEQKLDLDEEHDLLAFVKLLVS